MSIDALRWAFQQQGITSSQKLVLLALADRANEADECYPSIAQIRLDTCLKVDTICGATRALEEIGLIARQRRYNNSTVYRLIGVPGRHQIPETGNSRNRGYSIPETGNSSYPETGKLTPIKPPLNPKKARTPRATPQADTAPAGIDPDAWRDWIAYRKQARKPMTPATVDRQAAFLLRFVPADQRRIIEQSITAGWTGLFEPKNNNGSAHNDNARSRPDTSAAGSIRANVARARAARAAAAPDRDHLADDGITLRAPLG